MKELASNPFKPFETQDTYIKPFETDRSDRDSKYAISSIHKEFQDFILQDAYPCVGAQAAVNGSTYTLGCFGKMEQEETAGALACGLYHYLNETLVKPSTFLTYIAIFPHDSFATENAFEGALWELLSQLSIHDRKYFDWDPSVSDDPTQLDFSYSFGEKAFFIVGLHPESSRPARRFRFPALAFNLHGQFEALRESGRYETMQKVIRNRERNFSNSINPMLADHGQGLEAPQYSGRRVGLDWKCPFLNPGTHV